MEFKDIIPYFTNHGFLGVVTLALLFIIYTATKADWFGTILSKLSDKFVEYFMKRKTTTTDSGIKLITESDIINHDIFNFG